MKTGKPITKGVYFANTIEGSEKYASYVQFPVYFLTLIYNY